ncbi:MAG: ATP-binding protein [Lachnospiraceae bacterium]|nr:ATP-binding protein [Lachnospiraceae bacterium]
MITGVLTTIALQLGNVVDAMIVGNILGSMGNGAVSASTPYLYILQAAALLLGSGGAVSFAVLLGRRELQKAGKVMGFCMIFSVIYPLIFTILSPILVPAFVSMVGATGELQTMIHDITEVYSLGMPILSFVLVMAYLINVDNHPAMTARIHIVANVTNLILDFILVKYTPLGIKGAALSTVLGYLISGLIFIPQYYRSKNRMVSPVLGRIFDDLELIGGVIKNGFPNLATLILTVISVSIINAVVIRALGNAYFSAYAVANNTQLIVQMFLNGVSSVIASVAGVLYGEKDYYGMRRVLSRVLKTGLMIGAVIMVIFLLVPRGISALYGYDNPEIEPLLLDGLRIFSLSFMFFVLNAISQNYYRTIGQTFLSTFSSTVQLVVLKVPMMLLGMKLLGFPGLFAGIIISELLSFIMLHLLRWILQLVGRVPQKGFMAIPERNIDEICDLTVTGSDAQAVAVSEQIMDYCKKQGADSKKATAMGIAVEELISNIGRYGYPDSKDKYIDVCLFKTDGSYFLRLRDDGIPFNPVSYEVTESEGHDISGLELIKKLAVKITYMRVISLNNTIIEITDADPIPVNAGMGLT